MKRRLASTEPALHVVVPGAIDQATGGYRYAARIVACLRRSGWRVAVHELAGRFPDCDGAARRAAAAAMAAAPRGALTVIDGLALPAFAPIIGQTVQRLKCVALIHHPLALETGLSVATRTHFAALEPMLVKHIGRAIVTSGVTAAQVAAMGVPPASIAVVEPGLDRARPLPARRPGRLHLLSVATISPRKGHLAAVRALRGLHALRWRFTVVGSTTRDPAHARRVRAAVLLARLAGRTIFTGEVAPAATAAYYARAGLFILPSEHEGYGMAFAEAMAHSLPVIGVRAGAVPDTVPRGAGILVRPRAVGPLRRALRAMIRSPRRRRRHAAIARAHARRLHDWPATAQRFGAAAIRLAGP
jgi:glycosyltransferase involved in cell wall biosynthesis